MPAISSYPNAASFHANAKLLGTDENGDTKNFTKAQVQGGIDHGGLSGLGDDDHTIYAKADGSRDFSAKVKYAAHPSFSADTELVDKKYVDDAITAGGGYTDEQAQDAVGNILNATRFTYNDAGGAIDLSASVQTSLGKADTALQPGDGADNLVAGSTNKFATAAEKTKLSNITVSQAVDLDAVKTTTNHLTVTAATDLDALRTKLATVATNADVTNATNVGTSINGASAKTSYVAADKFPLLDSAASNALKYITGTNLELSLKTYTDTLYAAASHGHSWSSITSKPQNLVDIAALSDPNADRILFWDDSAGAYGHLTVGTNLSISGTTLNATGGGGGGGGDMYIATYDPTAKNSDAFLMSNMAEDTNAKVMTAAERAKVGHLTVTQAVDLDTMESDLAGKLVKSANLSDLTNAATALTNLGLSANGASLVTAANYAAMKALLDLEIGTDIQAYDADLTSWAGVTRASGFDTFAGTPSSANLKALLTDETGSGAAVFGTSPTIATPALTDPVITGAIQEDIYTITDAAGFEIDPGNGTIQLVTLGANRTPAATNFANGESVTLMIADGTAFTITWSTVAVTWVGGSAPTLATSGYTVVVLWKVGGTIYGSRVGDVA